MISSFFGYVWVAERYRSLWRAVIVHGAGSLICWFWP
jgi:hypothetical protein